MIAVEIEVRGIETFYIENRKRRRVVYRIRGERVLRDLEIDADREYSEEELKELIASRTGD